MSDRAWPLAAVEQVASGWGRRRYRGRAHAVPEQGRDVDVSDLSITAEALGRWATNCVVVANHATGSGIVVDPGEHGAVRLPQLVAALDVQVEAVLLTHGHLDHTWAAPALAEQFDVDIHLHPGDHDLWANPGATFNLVGERALELLEQQLGLAWAGRADRLVDLVDGVRLDLAGLPVDVTHTPGHTPGSVTFLLPGVTGADVRVDAGGEHVAGGDVLLAGDLLFAGSIGRTDLPGGDTGTMMASLAAHLPVLDADTLVVPGHGPETTVGDELAGNPFVRRALAT